MITKEDLKSLIGRIKKATGKTQREISEGAGYKADSLSELMAQKNSNCSPAYRRLELIYAEVLKNSIPPATARKTIPKAEYFTADQLFQMYMKAMERQDEIMAAQTVLLKDIKREMAKDANLNSILENQDGGLGLLIELAKRDARREAGDNEEKYQKILDGIRERSGLNWDSFLQKGS